MDKIKKLYIYKYGFRFNSGSNEPVLTCEELLITKTTAKTIEIDDEHKENAFGINVFPKSEIGKLFIKNNGLYGGHTTPMAFFTEPSDKTFVDMLTKHYTKQIKNAKLHLNRISSLPVHKKPKYKRKSDELSQDDIAFLERVRQRHIEQNIADNETISHVPDAFEIAGEDGIYPHDTL